MLLSRRPSPSLGSSIFQRLAPSSSGLAPALGRYSPPLCGGNKMAAAVPPCARIHSPLFVAPSAQAQALLLGGCARTVVPSLLPGQLTFPPAGAFVCCFGPAHARTCWSTHPLTSRASQRARRENLLLPLLDLPLCSGTSLAVGGCQVHTSSQGGKHVFFVLNTVLNRVPGIPFPRRVERMDSLSSQI